MNWMDSVATGAQGLMDNIDTAASSSAWDSAVDTAGSLFASAADYAVEAFDWVEQNPGAANVLGGLATGAASYYAQQERFDFEREMYDRQRQDQMINPGTIENYGTHVGTAKKGLLSNGMIAGGQ